MRLTILLLWCLAVGSAPAAEGDRRPLGAALDALVAEALANNPDVARAKAVVDAERHRTGQAGALPDLMLSLGIQNDGFSSIQIGKMETSWYSIMLSQTFPWFGKQGLRESLAGLQMREADAAFQRSRLSTEAAVRRAYLDLLLVRDQLGLLHKLELLWAQSEDLARARYEAGQGAQSDLLRAQLERSRLQQRRWLLKAEESRRLENLNQLRGRPLDDAIETAGSLADLPDTPLPELDAAIGEAESRSPELARAELALQQSEQRTALAKKDYFPDFAISAGVMPRGGPFEPMWQAGLSLNLPIWAAWKQKRSIAESESRHQGSERGVDAVRRLLHLRVSERLALLTALRQSNRLYRAGLLVQSEATVSSTIAQYRVGRVTFASVLDALAGYLNDVNGFFESLAAAERLLIAQREVSLEPLASSAAPLSSTPMPGSGAATSVSGAGPSTTSSAPESSSMSRM